MKKTITHKTCGIEEEKKMTEREMKVAYLQRIMDETDYEAMDQILIEEFQANAEAKCAC